MIVKEKEMPCSDKYATVLDDLKFEERSYTQIFLSKWGGKGGYDE